MRSYLLQIILILLTIPALAQEEEEPNYSLSGYVSYMQQNLIFYQSTSGVSNLLTDNLLHNRIKYERYLSDNWTVRVDIRNRVLWGEFTKSNITNPTLNYSQLIDDSANDAVKLSAIILDHKEVLVHSALDRLYVEYADDYWEVRLGRQRINWGISTVWNPNDLFNTFSFFDFDYVEQPGSDALRVSRYFGDSDKLEFAVSPSKDFDKWTAALLWKTNIKSYDFQLLTAWVEDDFVLGTGWEGNIKSVGFKGEASYFVSSLDAVSNSLNATLSWDYSFTSGWIISLGVLYNSNGETEKPFQQIFDFRISSKNLYPYRWAIFSQLSIPFNPLMNGSIAFIFSPVSSKPLFINPRVTYSLADNWDISLVGQLIFSDDVNNEYQNYFDGIFGRLKWSF